MESELVLPAAVCKHYKRLICMLTDLYLQISIVKRLREDIAPPRGYGGRGGYDRYDRGGGGYGR
jgi:hypothetical protein